jgi:uncharacterized protein YdaU (DUF1376 family)
VKQANEVRSKMHYYSFHIGDYKSHTHHLTLMEDLAYRRLLDHYYLHQAPIKEQDIARQIGMREQEQDVLIVLNEFFVSTEDGFVNPRADKEIAAYVLMAEAGKRGADKRWKKGGDSHPIATPSPPLTPPNTNHEPVTNNHKPITKNQLNTNICPPDGEPVDKLPDCQHQAVIDLYHQHLPTLRRVEVWNAVRQGYLRQRWREVAAELGKDKPIGGDAVLSWFAEFFGHINKSKFLTGKVNSKDGRAFAADLEWILKPSNFAKIVEGKYHGVN